MVKLTPQHGYPDYITHIHVVHLSVLIHARVESVSLSTSHSVTA